MKKLLLAACALLFMGHIQSQTTTAFRVNFDQALFDLPANAIEGLTSQQYVFAGTNLNFLPIYGTITEVDGSGNLLWSKRYYDGSLGFQINDIKKDASLNEYYVCGGSESNAAVFMRVNSTGAVVVSKKFSISEADGAYFNRVIKASDGGYVAVGYVTGYDPDGAGPEMDFVPYNYIDANGDPQTEVIGSPLIVKMDANGNHLWHKVFRYYDAAGKTPADRIYNDASFNDVVETSDGYIAVGSYDVNDVLSNTNSDGDDATANDALVLKTNFAGTITYHLQYDALNFSPTQSSKYLNAINKTSTGVPIAAGSADNGKEWIVKFGAAGGWSSIYSRLFTYSTFFGTPDPVEVSQIYEIPGSTDLLTMGMYVKPLSFVFSNSVHRINSTATTNVWAKYYTFSLATILPKGSLTADNSMVMLSTVMGGANFDYHLIKTDPNGDTPLAGCAPVSFTPTAAAGTTTTVNPYFNSWSGTVGSQALAVIVASITPTQSIQCQTIVSPCTPPAAATTVTATPSTICAGQSSTITASGPASNVTYNVYTAATGGTNLGAAPLVVSPASTTTYYVETVDNTNPSCVSVTRTAVTVTVTPAPTAPVIGTITQPTCTVSTGSVALSGLPASGTWTVTASPGGATITGTGTTGTFTGLAPGTYTFTVSSSSGTTTLFNETFESGGTGWSLNVVTGAEGADPNFFVVNDNEGGVAPPGCGVATNGNKTLHITSVFNPSGGAAYDAGGLCGLLFCPQTNRRAESPAISSVGQSGLTLNFKYIANGQAGQDFATVWYNDGTGWYQLGAALASPVCGSGQGQWSNYSSALPASCNNIANLKIAIKWQNNDDGVGTDPSVAINDITITAPGVGCTSPASLSATINAQPTTPTAPIVGTVTQPTCSTPTGSVALSGLPASGTWTVTGSPSGSLTSTGTTGTVTGLTPGSSYTFTVTNASGCTSTASTASGMINAAPTVPTAPIVGTITQPTCATPTGSVALSGLPASGSWTVTGSPSGSLTSSGTTGTVTGLTPGTSYTFTVTNASGCTSTASTSANINTVPGAPSAPVIGTITQPTCTVATGSIALSGLPASGTWTVTGSPSGSATGTGTTTTISGLAAGTSYTFTVTNDLGCTSSASTSGVLNAQPTTPSAPVIGTVTQPDCTTPTGSVALSGLPASGTWTVTGSPSGSLTSTGTTGTVTGLAPGSSYTFTVTNVDGCTSSASTASGMINAAPTVPTAPIVGTITQPTCATPTGSVALSGLPASGSWTVTGSPSGSLTSSGTTGTVTGLTAGTSYTFTVTNASGCTSTASTSANINTVPGAPTAPVIGTITQPTCTVATGSIALSGLPASGTWTVTGSPSGSATGTGTTTTISGLAAGTSYTFTVTNDLGCTSSASTSGVLNAQPTTPSAPVLGTVTQPDCTTPTGSVDLSGLPAGAWTITGSPSGSATGSGTTTTFTGLTPGSSYTFTVTDDVSGCTSTASTATGMINAAPTVPTAPIVGTITQPDCATPTGSVALSGLPASGSWTVTGSPSGSLTSSGTTGTVTGLTAGTSYTFTVTNASGCTSTASTSASINTVPGAPTAPVIGTITQPTCTVATGSIALSGLPASGTWTVTGSPSGSATGTGTTTTISGLAAGTSYTFTVTNDLGCTSSASTSGVLNAQPATPSAPVVGTVTQPDCTTPTGSVDLSGLPAGSWTITGTPSGSASGTGTTTTISGLAPGSSYTYTVTDNTSGCTSSASTATGTINAAPTVPTSPIVGTITQPTCTTPTGTVDLSGLPASGTWTITGSPSGSATGTGATGAVSGLTPGATYTFTVTNTDGCTSTGSTSAVINSLPAGPTAPTAGTTVQPTCAVPTGTIEVTAPIGSYSYSIDGTNFQSSTTFTGVAPGSYTITVQDDNTGCSTPSTSQVVVDPVTGAPIITVVSTTDVSCNGLSDGAIEISVSGGASPYTYAWTPNTGSGAILTSLAAGSYTVDVTDNTGCSSSETITINEPNAVAVNGTSSNVDCASQIGGSITTAASGGDGNYSYTWTPNGETTSSITNVSAGSYGVTVTDGNGCSATSNYTITTTGSLPVVIDPDYSLIDPGTSVQLTATGGTNYSWTPNSTLSCSNCPNPIASPTTTTTYYLSATDDNGCTGGDTAVVELKIACGDIYVPNTFSPNGTGPAANNTLKVFGNPACVEQLLFRVFDRWGELVFETTSISEEWNGQYKGKDMNTGIFVYTLYVLTIDGNEIDESGNVTLVR